MWFSSQNYMITWCSHFVSSVVCIAFPGVKDRFEKSKAWHKKEYDIDPMFGVFWNFCLNGLFFDQPRVHCRPHADSKNPISVCALMTYILKGCKCFYTFTMTQGLYTLLDKFNHTVRTWLVIWEAGVIVHLPPWVLFVYPSSLFYHFNIDIHGGSDYLLFK